MPRQRSIVAFNRSFCIEDNDASLIRGRRTLSACDGGRWFPWYDQKAFRSLWRGVTEGELAMSVLVRVVTVAAVLGACCRAMADDPLPQPRVVEMPPGLILGGPPIYRRSAYDVWRYYGVDRRGFFRPVVVYSPYGSYYLYDGAPFPWTTTHQREFMPYVVDRN
jgi:hypothetical protein